MKVVGWRGGMVAAMFALGAGSVPGCGGWHEEPAILGNEERLLEMPEGNFYAELRRLFGPGLPEDYQRGSWERTLEADLADLKGALGGGATAEQADLLKQYQAMREAMGPAGRGNMDHYSGRAKKDKDPGAFELAAYEPLLARLPTQFALYARGGAAFRARDYTGAIAAWTELLSLPEGERRERTLWATYMIGKAWLKADAQKAPEFFEQTRALAEAGLPDPLGLAALSHGWQGQVALKSGDVRGALVHYYGMQRAGTREEPFGTSLSGVAGMVFRQEKLGPELLRDETSRKVLTAWALANGSRMEGAMAKLETGIREHGIEVTPVEADNLAWAAYKAGDMEGAARWVGMNAEHTPIGDWVQAKLLLREGKIDEGLKLLGSVSSAFAATMQPQPLQEGVILSRGDYPGFQEKAQQERGVLLLGRKDYGEALNAFARSDARIDLAYLVERVLEMHEVSAWLRAHKDDPTINGEGDGRSGDQLGATYRNIGYMLARRLARAHMWDQARTWYPPEFLPQYDEYRGYLSMGYDDDLPKRERAEGLIKAAYMMRYRGMALFGTEIGPDWKMWYGNFEDGSGFEGRMARRERRMPHPRLTRAVTPTQDERDRVAMHYVMFEKRYHYRYRASEITWHAASMLPNQDEATMQALFWGGTWHKVRDPQYADRFYKALVRRNLPLPLAQEADTLRWFPYPSPFEPEVELRKPSM